MNERLKLSYVVSCCVTQSDVCTEARQQTSLTEWCDASQTPVRQREREKTPGCVLQENDLLDDGGDGVFSQMVF